MVNLANCKNVVIQTRACRLLSSSAGLGEELSQFASHALLQEPTALQQLELVQRQLALLLPPAEPAMPDAPVAADGPAESANAPSVELVRKDWTRAECVATVNVRIDFGDAACRFGLFLTHLLAWLWVRCVDSTPSEHSSTDVATGCCCQPAIYLPTCTRHILHW